MKGFSVVEVLLSISILGLLALGIFGALIYGQESSGLSGQRARAVYLAEEGLEAVRNLRDANYANLTNGTFGLSRSGNQWSLLGSSDTTDNFTRAITISDDGTNRKRVVSTVTWVQTAQRNGSVSLTTRLTNWKSVAPTATPTPTGVSPTNTPTPTPTPAFASCQAYCVSLGTYTVGTCRGNSAQCNSNGQTNQSGGNIYCTGGAQADTCCCN